MLKSLVHHFVTYFHFYVGWDHTQIEANVLIFFFLMLQSKGKKNQRVSWHRLMN